MLVDLKRGEIQLHASLDLVEIGQELAKVVAMTCSLLWMSDCLRSTDCFVGKNESPIPIIYDIYKGTVSRFEE